MNHIKRRELILSIHLKLDEVYSLERLQKLLARTHFLHANKRLVMIDGQWHGVRYKKTTGPDRIASEASRDLSAWIGKLGERGILLYLTMTGKLMVYNSSNKELKLEIK